MLQQEVLQQEAPQQDLENLTDVQDADVQDTDVQRDPFSGGIVPDTTLPFVHERTGKVYFDHERGPDADAARAEAEALWAEMEAEELRFEQENAE